jgi:hypothetical protein
MAQPTAYDRLTSFSNYQAANPSDPLSGSQVDAEFNAVKQTLDEVLANLELLQRDDGALANESVGLDQLSEEIEVGWQAPEVWVTATAYVVGDTVFNGSGFYRCLVAHTAGTFATDLAAAKWELIVDLSAVAIVDATQIAFTPTGGIAASTVAAALAELDSEKAASSHTHPSSAISDSTAAGRAMLAAADVAAQQTLLGLGDLAFLDSVSVTEISGALAFTGDISPAAISGSVTNWAPTGWATASRIRASASSTVAITGLLATTDGDRKVIENIGTVEPLTFYGENTGSSAANRIAAARPITLYPGQSVTFEYDGTSVRWRPLSSAPASPVQTSYKNLRVHNVATVLGDTAPATPSTQIKIAADSIILASTSGDTHQATSVALTASTGTAGANGLDTGIVAVSTWYSVWVIFNPTTNTVAALLSTSATSPTMPSGYTFKARVGWDRTDGTSALHRIAQYGNRAQYVVSASITTALPVVATGSSGSTSVPTWTATAVGSFVPSTASVLHGVLSSSTSGGASSHSAMAAPNSLYGAVSSLTNPPPAQVTVYDHTGFGTASSVSFSFALESTNIQYASSNANGRVFCLGWDDNI